MATLLSLRERYLHEPATGHHDHGVAAARHGTRGTHARPLVAPTLFNAVMCSHSKTKSNCRGPEIVRSLTHTPNCRQCPSEVMFCEKRRP
eukprot:1107351-Prymnesium_polylepis.1